MYSSMFLLFSSNTLYITVTCFVLTLVLIVNELNSKQLKKKFLWKSATTAVSGLVNEMKSNNNSSSCGSVEAPGPRGKFIVGNLDILDGYDIPYKAFTDLARKYGKIIKLRLGRVPCLVINGVESIKEVLIYKGHHFNARPNFKRYHMLFSGNKENSLAFCDWSDLQKTRRDMLIPHTFPRTFSMSFNRFNDITIEHCQQIADDIKKDMNDGRATSIKPVLLSACANIFTEYFTTRTFDTSDKRFQQLIKNFDKIFWEVNQGYAADFLPFLLPFHTKRIKQLEQWSREIRTFILEDIIGDRFTTWNVGNEPNDYIESLIDHVKRDSLPRFEWETALFALEDIVGGHSAAANFLVKVIAFIAQHPQVQKNIQAEVDNLLNSRDEKTILIGDRNKLIYTEAAIMESLRMISSPIVPHVASQDSTIDGYTVKAGTLIFLNNYDLNMSPSLWEEPEKFEPNRFISSGRLLKPEHFIPFGVGTRSCMGYKLVQFVSFAAVSNLLKEFDISTIHGAADIKVPLGSLALSEDPYQFVFSLRN